MMNTVTSICHIIINYQEIDLKIFLSDGVDDIVDLENGPDRLGGQVDRGRRHEQRLHDILIEYVGDGALPHVDAGAFLALGVAVAQLGHRRDGVKACVLGQCVRDDLEGLGEGLEAVCVSSHQGVGVIHQLQGQLGLCGIEIFIIIQPVLCSLNRSWSSIMLLSEQL